MSINQMDVIKFNVIVCYTYFSYSNDAVVIDVGLLHPGRISLSVMIVSCTSPIFILEKTIDAVKNIFMWP